jgi:hypothetical protein
MVTDSVYLSLYPRVLNTLLEACNGDFSEIPDYYLDNFRHTYANGDISLVPALSSLSGLEFADSWHVEEAVEHLSRVNPTHWPDIESIADIDLSGVLSEGGEVLDNISDFVEDNLGTAEKVEKVLSKVIESVFGNKVHSIRDASSSYPSERNNFLQQPDGTFSGSFKFESHTFLFQIAPNEGGWICTYRLSEKSLDDLEKPEYKGKTDESKVSKNIRVRAWS